MSRTSCNTLWQRKRCSFASYNNDRDRETPSCLFKEQDTSTLLLWQACQTQSGPSSNYLSTRLQCFITLSSLSQTTHPLFI